MRVVDTPITELGFAGVGVGAAMVGLRPIVEFMTWNFALLALDQVVNAAAKMLYMSGGQYNMPIVFRGPNGAALQLSAQHSQAWESWLAHIPGLKVVAPGTPYDAKGLLKSAIRDDNPVIVLEGEMLYNIKGEVPDEEYLDPARQGRAEARGRSLLDHHERQDGARRDAGRRPAREGRDQGRRRGPPHDPSDGRRRDHGQREEDQSRRGARGRLGGLRHRRADRGLHPARLLRPSRRARGARAPGRHADAVRQGARDAPRSPTCPRRSRRSRKSCTSRPDHGDQGVHGGALAHDGRGAPREVAEERGRRGEERRRARRGRDRQGRHGAGGARRRRAAQAARERGRGGAGGDAGRGDRGGGGGDRGADRRKPEAGSRSAAAGRRKPEAGRRAQPEAAPAADAAPTYSGCRASGFRPASVRASVFRPRSLTLFRFRPHASRARWPSVSPTSAAWISRASPAAAPAAASSSATSRRRCSATAVPASGAPAQLPSSGLRSVVDFEDVPLTQIRKTIARRLAESLGPIPTFYLTAEFDLQRASEMRAAMAGHGRRVQGLLQRHHPEGDRHGARAAPRGQRALARRSHPRSTIACTSAWRSRRTTASSSR